MLTRRVLCRLLFTALGFAVTGKRVRGAAAPSLGVEGLLSRSELPLPAAAIRRYRADVVITLLGIRVFAREGVGRAFAAIREAAEGQTKIIALQFAGGAIPERSHGVRFDGSMEEVVLEGSSREAGYFGFVTRSANENYDQARRRILNGAERACTYVAVEGLHSAGCARSERTVVSLPDRCGRGLSELIEQIRAGFRARDRIAEELHTPGVSAPRTFLHSVFMGLRSGSVRFQRDYVHSARRHSLELERISDQPGPVMRFTGRVRDLATQRVSVFWIWLDNRSCLPLRIEFHPRSYLRISLDYQPDGASQNTKCTEG